MAGFIFAPRSSAAQSWPTRRPSRSTGSMPNLSTCLVRCDAFTSLFLRVSNLLSDDRSLLQQAIDFDFTSGAEVDAAVDYDRDDEAGGQGGAVALAVLFGVVDRLAPLGCIGGGEDGVVWVGGGAGFC